MTGPMRRIFRRRAADSPLAADPPPVEAAQEATPLPAGIDPEVALPEHPSFRDRGRMRRRLRYLRRARELGFRDLGGLVFDLRRFGREREDLVEAKVRALFAVDRELRALETALNARVPIHELREPGVTSCPHCGALHGSDARFCPACGTPLQGPRAVAEVGEGLLPIGLGLPPVRAGAEDLAARIPPGGEGLVADGETGADAGAPDAERHDADVRTGGSESLFGDPGQEREALERGLDEAFLGAPGLRPDDEPGAHPDEPAPFPEDARPPAAHELRGSDDAQPARNGDHPGARRPDERGV